MSDMALSPLSPLSPMSLGDDVFWGQADAPPEVSTTGGAGGVTVLTPCVCVITTDRGRRRWVCLPLYLTPVTQRLKVTSWRLETPGLKHIRKEMSR